MRRITALLLAGLATLTLTGCRRGPGLLPYAREIEDMELMQTLGVEMCIRDRGSDVLPYNNYPIPIEAGQVFAIDYNRKDGTSERKYYRSDGEVWNGMDCTTEFIPE